MFCYHFVRIFSLVVSRIQCFFIFWARKLSEIFLCFFCCRQRINLHLHIKLFNHTIRYVCTILKCIIYWFRLISVTTMKFNFHALHTKITIGRFALNLSQWNTKNVRWHMWLLIERLWGMGWILIIERRLIVWKCVEAKNIRIRSR